MPQPHQYQLSDFIPTTQKEMKLRGWERADVIFFSGDAYVDHPSFGVAVLARLLEAEGLRVAIVPQPSWHGDLRDFKRLGRPRLFFAIAPGCMDSMVNKYTANRRLRSEDAYSPDGRHDMRPEYPTIVYTHILRELYPDTPVVIGGIEASLRRLTHYDYWKGELRPSILTDSGADLLIYGMGEAPLTDLCTLLNDTLESYATAADTMTKNDTNGEEDGEVSMTRSLFRNAISRMAIRQTATLETRDSIRGGIRGDDILLHSHEVCLKDRKRYAENFKHIEEESNKYEASRLIQQVREQYIVVNPPYPPMTTGQIDRAYDLPYTRLPHPKYKGKRIPAYETIKYSVTLHRGCFGGCAFCTISAHQGKFIMSRSKESILREVEAVTRMEGFSGNLSDLGGPSANMYRMGGKDTTLCRKCKRPSCIHPAICPNLHADHRPLTDIYRAVDALPQVRHSYIGSGVRYDLLLADYKDPALKKAARDYTEELICHHVSGRLKVAPEHTSPKVLELMRKPSFDLFKQFKTVFDTICRKAGLRQQIIPYFISSHPGCTAEDMAELAAITKHLDFKLEQVQDFTPTPMTVATTTWYAGYHPYTLRPVWSAHSPTDKLKQRMFFFWYKADERKRIMAELKRIGRTDLIGRLFTLLTLALAGIAALSPNVLMAQSAHNEPSTALQAAIRHVDYGVESRVTATDGETPLWLSANRYGLSGVEYANGYLRLQAGHRAENDSLRKWRIGWRADVAATYGMSAPFVIQQLYTDIDYRALRLTIGAKEEPMQLKNNLLSSGSQTMGINARPMPNIRIALPEYLSLTGKSDWVAIKGHFGYGMLTDGGFQKDYCAMDAKRTEKVLYHTKAGYLRIGNEKKFPLSFEGGLEWMTYFGGTAYIAGSVGGIGSKLEMPQRPKDFFDAIFGLGGDATDGDGYANATGNTVGSWIFRLNYKANNWRASIYLDHFFEDHSQMFFEYGWLDGLLGAEVELPQNPFVSTIVYEFLKTTYQSGPVYHDHTAAIPDQISGADDYYNHSIYQGHQHWGQAVGNPLYTSPLYRHDGTLTFSDNRFIAHHIGLMGQPTASLSYRLLYSHERSHGTYPAPHLTARHTDSFLIETTWRPQKPIKHIGDGWECGLALGMDRGNLIGNNFGLSLHIVKRGMLIR